MITPSMQISKKVILSSNGFRLPAAIHTHSRHTLLKRHSVT